MKRILSAVVCLGLVLGLAACGGGKPAAKTPEELDRAYRDAITAAQSQEEREAFPVIEPEDEMYQPVLAMMGLSQEDLTASCVVVSLRGIQAYSIVAAMPAQGREEAVTKALEGYVEVQKNNFQFYLEDQFDIASNAKLETLSDGTVLLVMCDGQDGVFNAIRTALEK